MFILILLVPKVYQPHILIKEIIQKVMNTEVTNILQLRKKIKKLKKLNTKFQLQNSQITTIGSQEIFTTKQE